MEPKKIRSRDNPAFKMWLRLRHARGIKKEGLALLSGLKQVREILATHPEQCAGIICTEEHAPLIGPSTLPRYCLSPSLFRMLDLFGTDQPLLLVRVPPFAPFVPEQCPSGCTLCVPFQDPVNVGAVIRTAAALGVAGMVMLEEAAHPFHPRSLRSAGTSIFKVPLLKGPSIIRLDTKEIPLITLSPQGKNVKDFRFPSTFCLLPGLEGPGLPGPLKPSAQLAVPMERDVESLNAATAAAIVLYQWHTGG